MSLPESSHPDCRHDAADRCVQLGKIEPRTNHPTRTLADFGEAAEDSFGVSVGSAADVIPGVPARGAIGDALEDTAAIELRAGDGFLSVLEAVDVRR